MKHIIFKHTINLVLELNTEPICRVHQQKFARREDFILHATTEHPVNLFSLLETALQGEVLHSCHHPDCEGKVSLKLGGFQMHILHHFMTEIRMAMFADAKRNGMSDLVCPLTGRL